jgi:hypothetical protein
MRRHKLFDTQVESISIKTTLLSIATFILLCFAVSGFVMSIVALTKSDDNSSNNNNSNSNSTTSNSTDIQYNITTGFYQGDDSTNVTLTGEDYSNITIRCLITDNFITIGARQISFNNTDDSLPSSGLIKSLSVINENCFPSVQLTDGTYVLSDIILGEISVFNNASEVGYYIDVRVELNVDSERLRFVGLEELFNTVVSIPDWTFTFFRYLAKNPGE